MDYELSSEDRKTLEAHQRAHEEVGTRVIARYVDKLEAMVRELRDIVQEYREQESRPRTGTVRRNMTYDDWKTTEPYIQCFHPPCPHGHCADCEGERCEQCEIGDEELLLEQECDEAAERCVEPPDTSDIYDPELGGWKEVRSSTLAGQ